MLPKGIFSPSDINEYSPKRHFHNEFEIHIILKGMQKYEINDAELEVKSGMLLLLPPKLKHSVLYINQNTEKISLCFGYDSESDVLLLPEYKKPYLINAPNGIADAISFISGNTVNSKRLSHLLASNRILEMIILIFREMGMNEGVRKNSTNISSPILTMAKQYINDNICSSPTVKEVALYCHISERQLSRIFIKHEGVSVSDYIKTNRLETIKELLNNNELSLKEISEQTGFNNEYYFNSFFKNGYGLPPASYRNSLK